MPDSPALWLFKKLYGSHSNSVKWINERSVGGGGWKPTEYFGEPDRERRGGRNSARGGLGKAQPALQDDPSVDDTYTDEYTAESQSQYTMETYE